MKWMSVYLLGYIVFMAGVFWGLSYWGVLDAIGPTWTGIAAVLALGLGIMVAVTNSAKKERSVEID